MLPGALGSFRAGHDQGRFPFHLPELVLVVWIGAAARLDEQILGPFQVSRPALGPGQPEQGIGEVAGLRPGRPAAGLDGREQRFSRFLDVSGLERNGPEPDERGSLLTGGVDLLGPLFPEGIEIGGLVEPAGLRQRVPGREIGVISGQLGFRRRLRFERDRRPRVFDGPVQVPGQETGQGLLVEPYGFLQLDRPPEGSPGFFDQRALLFPLVEGGLIIAQFEVGRSGIGMQIPLIIFAPGDVSASLSAPAQASRAWRCCPIFANALAMLVYSGTPSFRPGRVARA